MRDGTLLTPPAIDGALEGITRRSILELAQRRKGLPFAEERSLGRFDLFAAERSIPDREAAHASCRSVPSMVRPIGGPARPMMDQLSLAASARLTQEAGTPLDG